MTLDQLEANMFADLGRQNANSVLNEIKSLGIKHPKARQGMAKVFNQFLELSRQVREGEMRRPEGNNFIRKNLLPQVSDHIKWAVEGDPDVTPGYEPPKKDDDFMPELEMRVNKELLNKFEASKEDLKAQLVKHHHVVAYAPTLPLCKPTLIPDKLVEKGFKISKIGYYVVLERQIVLGIDNAWIKEKVEAYRDLAHAYTTMEGLEKEAKKSSATNGTYGAVADNLRTLVITTIAHMQSSDEAQAILRRIKPTKPLRAIEDADVVVKSSWELRKVLAQQMLEFDGQVTEKSLIDSFVKSAAKTLKKPTLAQFENSVNYLGATWVWLLTPKEISVLQSCAMGGHFSLTRWGFAFSS